MNRATLAAIAVLGIATSGCARHYKPPTADQPHATLKLRRTYQTAAGTHLRERVSIEEHEAFAERTVVELVAGPRTDALLAHPTTAELRVDSAWVHIEMRMVQETYYVQVPYTTTESYSCGSGTSYRMCTRMVTQTRSEPRTRTVLRPVEVVDAACKATLWINPARDHSYVFDYTYAESGSCRLACYEQVPGAEASTFEMRNCTPPPPESIKAALEAR